MKILFRTLLISVSLLFSLSPCYAQQAWLSAPLANALEAENVNKQFLKVNIILREKVNLDSLQTVFRNEKTELPVRAKTTIRLLMEKANTTQKNILAHINANNHSAKNIQPLWICNLIIAELKPPLIKKLQQFSEIEYMELATEHIVEPVAFSASKQLATKTLNGHEPGLSVIGSPFMWNLGYTGHGRRMYSVDTGCWTQHPAIGSRFLGNFFPMQQCWFPYDSPLPADKSSSHGTHILGTTLGLHAANNDTIGSAFNAYWIATDPIVQNPADVRPMSELMLAFQFAMNPDGDTATTDDIPDAINNSWGIASNQQADTLCTSFVADVFNAVEAVGIASIHSAGNNGPAAQTIGRPAFINTSLVNLFAVGAVNAHDLNFPIASFSSRGPSFCATGGSLEIKPEVSAPGVNVRSSIGQNGYDEFSGTSMASPHVTGAVLLLKEAFPFLPGEEIKYALYYTALDLGEPGEDNTYGMGIISVEAAYHYLAQNYSPVPPAVNHYDIAVEQILSPANDGFTCTQNFSPVIILKNKGMNPLTQADIFYGLSGGNESLFTWSGNLAPNESETLTLPAISFSGTGNIEFLVRAQLPDSINEYDYINNRRISRFNYRPTFDLPFMEDFENGIAPEVWFINNPDFDLTWDTVLTSGLGWDSYAAYLPFGSAIINNRTDDMISPILNLAGADSVTLRFDMSYQHKHNALSDSVSVFVSNDCGATFPHKIWQKGGTALSTWSINTNNFIPSLPEHWREETVNISQFAGEEIMLKFTGKNRRGNYFTIDNIWIYNGNKPASLGEVQALKISAYPNPAENYFSLETNQQGALMIYDLTGNEVYSTVILQARNVISIENLAAGIYLLHFGNESSNVYFKLLKK